MSSYLSNVNANTQILLVRCGENQNHFTGTDSGMKIWEQKKEYFLTDKGVVQAKKLNDYISKNFSFDAVYCSSRGDAIQTASIATGLSVEKLNVRSAFNEVHLGDLSGLTVADDRVKRSKIKPDPAAWLQILITSNNEITLENANGMVLR